MSPNSRPNNSNLPNVPLDIMNSYIVHVGEQTFRLYRSSITYDSPNFFTQAFLGEEYSSVEESGSSKLNSNAATSASASLTAATPSIVTEGNACTDNTSELVVADKGKENNAENTSTSSQTDTTKGSPPANEITIDRDPRLFEVILRYLRGYTILPLSSVNLPPGMSLELFRESLLEDARFYGLSQLGQLLQAETPTPLRYKDPFTSQDKILLSLRDVPIHKEFVRSKLEGPSAVEFFTGAVLTLELDPSEATIQFDTEFLNEQDQKALETLGDICGENTQIQLSRLLTTGWNMRDVLNGIRLEIDGVQVTGVDIASLVGASNPKVKALDDMFRIAGGQKLVIYAQEFVFRLEYRSAASSITDDGNSSNGGGGVASQPNGGGDTTKSDVNASTSDQVEEESDRVSQSGESNCGSSDTVDESNNKNTTTHPLNHPGQDNHPVYLGVVWAKGWTQEWWAWNEYRMKLDTLQ